MPSTTADDLFERESCPPLPLSRPVMDPSACCHGASVLVCLSCLGLFRAGSGHGFILLLADCMKQRCSSWATWMMMFARSKGLPGNNSWTTSLDRCETGSMEWNPLLFQTFRLSPTLSSHHLFCMTESSLRHPKSSQATRLFMRNPSADRTASWRMLDRRCSGCLGVY